MAHASAREGAARGPDPRPALSIRRRTNVAPTAAFVPARNGAWRAGPAPARRVAGRGGTPRGLYRPSARARHDVSRQAEIRRDALEQTDDIVHGVSLHGLQRVEQGLDLRAMRRCERERTQPLVQRLSGAGWKAQVADQDLARRLLERKREPLLLPAGSDQLVAVHPAGSRELNAIIQDEQVAGRKQPEIARIGDEVGL